MNDARYFLLSLVAAAVAFWLVGSGWLGEWNLLVIAIAVLAVLLFGVGFRNARREA